MNKLEYLCRQFSRAEKKPFEHYVVTRIWNLVNDLTIKIVTQQYVSRPEGRALTDLYFPQLQIHIEVDEGHHKFQIEWDNLREADIINATGHDIYRIDVCKDIESINREIDNIVVTIKNKKATINNFRVWDIDAESSPQTYINKGFIDLKDDCAFKTMTDAASCFGRLFKPKGIWKGGVVHPKEPGKIIWFPKLYPNDKWNNSITDDEKIIFEKSAIEEDVQRHIDNILNGGFHISIVFARVKSPLGDVMYRFKGEYLLDLNSTNYINGLVWRRIADSVQTYKY